MYSDTMHFKVKSLAQHTCAHIFATDDYVRAYPVCAEWLIPETLRTLAEDDGVPRELLTDNANINHDWTRGRVQQAGMVSSDRNALN